MINGVTGGRLIADVACQAEQQAKMEGGELSLHGQVKGVRLCSAQLVLINLQKVSHKESGTRKESRKLQNIKTRRMQERGCSGGLGLGRAGRVGRGLGDIMFGVTKPTSNYNRPIRRTSLLYLRIEAL